jgi:transposase
LRRGNDDITPRHVRRELAEGGMTYYIRPRHATRSRGDLKRRMDFAIKYRRADWRRIVFSDESWLTCNERTGKGQYAVSRSEVLPIESKCRWNVPSIMVWSTIGYGWKGPLIVFPSKKMEDGERRQFRLDAPAYVRRCLSTVTEKLKNEKRLFQQDGARAHIAKSVKGYLERKAVDYIPDWPPYTPEWNAIERIWNELHDLVGKRTPRTAEELIAAAHAAWEELPQRVIDAHCKHFHTQMLAFSRGR